MSRSEKLSLDERVKKMVIATHQKLLPMAVSYAHTPLETPLRTINVHAWHPLFGPAEAVDTNLFINLGDGRKIHIQQNLRPTFGTDLVWYFETIEPYKEGTRLQKELRYQKDGKQHMRKFEMDNRTGNCLSSLAKTDQDYKEAFCLLVTAARKAPTLQADFLAGRQ